MSKPIVIPSRQGELDYLCGIYSLVNAVAYLYDARVNRRRLKLALIRAYRSEWRLIDLFEDGLDDEKIDYLIDHVILHGYYHNTFPLAVSKPFSNQTGLRTKHILKAIERYLGGADSSGLRLVLIGTQYHWSLAKRMDDTFIYFFDSSGKHKAYRRSYSLIPGRTTYELIPSAIYFIERLWEA